MQDDRNRNARGTAWRIAALQTALGAGNYDFGHGMRLSGPKL